MQIMRTTFIFECLLIMESVSFFKIPFLPICNGEFKCDSFSRFLLYFFHRMKFIVNMQMYRKWKLLQMLFQYLLLSEEM
jgi:hypothetical protein